MPPASRNTGWALRQVLEPVVEYRVWPMARWPVEAGQGALVEDVGHEAHVLDDGDRLRRR